MFIYPLFLIAIGLCLGSFVNMLVYRVERAYGLNTNKPIKQFINKKNKKINLAQMLKRFPSVVAGWQNDGLQLLGGRSYCDYCQKQLHWYENMPVISWLVQGGKTRCCGKKLPGQYPLVEMAMGLLFGVFWIINMVRVETGHAPSLQILEIIVGCLILVFMVFAFVFDLKHMILPDFSTAILIILGVIYVLFMLLETPRSGGASLQSNVVGGLIGIGIIGGLYWITRGRAMGFGDVKLAVFMGTFLGVKNLIIALYVAFITGAIAGVYLLLLGKKKARSPIPFGPFLLLGTLVAWWFGAKIWYEAWLYFG